MSELVSLPGEGSRERALDCGDEYAEIDGVGRDVAPRLQLAWTPKEAIEQVSNGWRGKALEAIGVDFVYVDLGAETEATIRTAQVRQRR